MLDGLSRETRKSLARASIEVHDRPDPALSASAPGDFRPVVTLVIHARARSDERCVAIFRRSRARVVTPKVSLRARPYLDESPPPSPRRARTAVSRRRPPIRAKREKGERHSTRGTRSLVTTRQFGQPVECHGTQRAHDTRRRRRSRVSARRVDERTVARFSRARDDESVDSTDGGAWIRSIIDSDWTGLDWAPNWIALDDDDDDDDARNRRTSRVR